MKRRYREGTLTGERRSGADADPLATNPTSIYGLGDFLEKAERLADEMSQSGPERSLRAEKLRTDLAAIQALIESGVDPSRLYEVVGAGLSYANLAHEKSADAKSNRNRRFTRTEYFEAKRRSKSRQQLADALHISIQGLRRWEADNL